MQKVFKLRNCSIIRCDRKADWPHIGNGEKKTVVPRSKSVSRSFYFDKVRQDNRPQPERHGCVTDRSYLSIDSITTHYFSLQVACYII